MSLVTIDGREYKLNKINPMTQFHIVRRITPIMGKVLPLLVSVKSDASSFESIGETKQLDMLAKLATPVMEGLSSLSDADADFVLIRLLASVEMKDASTGHWFFIADGQVGMKYDTLELPLMINLAGRAFMHNLASFIHALGRK